VPECRKDCRKDCRKRYTVYDKCKQYGLKVDLNVNYRLTLFNNNELCDKMNGVMA